MENLLAKFMGCGRRLSTDSRAISGGELFFALRGENFDGNLYAGAAIKAGAAYAVVEKGYGVRGDGRYIEVEDTLQALKSLSRDYRRTLTIPVIGLTGTNGKTTTKELVRSVLSTRYSVAATRANHNNGIGVALTLLEIKPEDGIAVVEMGTDTLEGIRRHTVVAEPDYGLVTNVGKAHLLGFGSFEGVKAAKGRLYDYLSEHGGLAIVNDRDDVLMDMARSRKGMAIRPYNVDYRILEGESCFLAMEIDGRVLRTNLAGNYNAANVCAAIAVGREFGVPLDDALRAIGSYVPSNSRSQIIDSGRNTIIMDAYNANPSSMAAALENLAQIPSGRRIAMIGDMLELGEDSPGEHVAIARQALGYGFEVYFVGGEFAKALAGSHRSFGDAAELTEYLRANPVSGAVILLKGSRGIRMEQVLEAL